MLPHPLLEHSSSLLEDPGTAETDFVSSLGPVEEHSAVPLVHCPYGRIAETELGAWDDANLIRA